VAAAWRLDYVRGSFQLVFPLLRTLYKLHFPFVYSAQPAESLITTGWLGIPCAHSLGWKPATTRCRDAVPFRCDCNGAGIRFLVVCFGGYSTVMTAGARYKNAESRTFRTSRGISCISVPASKIDRDHCFVEKKRARRWMDRRVRCDLAASTQAISLCAYIYIMHIYIYIHICIREIRMRLHTRLRHSNSGPRR